jgi:hypothetical protein
MRIYRFHVVDCEISLGFDVLADVADRAVLIASRMVDDITAPLLADGPRGGRVRFYMRGQIIVTPKHIVETICREDDPEGFDLAAADAFHSSGL